MVLFMPISFLLRPFRLFSPLTDSSFSADEDVHNEALDNRRIGLTLLALLPDDLELENRLTQPLVLRPSSLMSLLFALTVLSSWVEKEEARGMSTLFVIHVECDNRLVVAPCPSFLLGVLIFVGVVLLEEWLS